MRQKKRSVIKGKTLIPFNKVVLFRFLKRTKQGRYAPIDEVSFPYSRIKQQTESVEEQYIYALR